jgi:hypothetical protein
MPATAQLLCLTPCPSETRPMKNIRLAGVLATALIATSVFAAGPTATAPASSPAVSGVILEIRDVESYSYIRLKTKDGETWAAVGRAPLKTGATVTITEPMVMKDFESKALKKTFPSIVFGNLAGSNKAAAEAHGGSVKVADTQPIKVPRATGANARTVAEVVTKASELKDKTVQVRAKVVKVNAAIMGKNWIHLRDGSGSAADNTHDVLVTSAAQTQVGDVVTVSGVVRVNKDFGAGYVYKVLIEDATIQP